MNHLSRVLRAGALGLSMIFAAGSVQAIEITEFYDASIDFGPGAGEQGTLTVIYDDDDITGVGEEFIGWGEEGEFSLELVILGMVFTEMDDLDFGNPNALGGPFPILFFDDGELNGLDFVVETVADGVDVFLVSFGISQGTLSMETFAVPVPGTALLALLGLGLMAHRRRG